MKKREEKMREVRRRSADWEFIRKQPLRLRIALEYLVEDGDLHVASRIAGLKLEEMNELRIKANIPLTS
ncbi:MAG: hypothetical protein DRN99_07965 [Thermoproteota archaeon]|nr:MAG: hypothetical protein DRN99_07965 [Candidatus Korarchaeota archaeon]